ncbi:phospholipid carrier-dependent glycosyltransferase [Leptolyngbya sp. PCC 6406]|uniref:phospholipid carrier-dependent glycosyltransferase n=1 Tax=Leptolyngbya sp. PCC 6406 TaxID=1173264 RepID=UPI0002ABBC5C|nr:phospholipid carrier-dependent glycosyltransferase [Leptolyngbya sp. PCC 6406]
MPPFFSPSLAQTSQQSWPWLGWGLVLGLTIVNLILRWGAMATPATLVFDEVYYVQFALDYLQGVPFFDLHPPLGKLAIAAGIWLFYAVTTGNGLPAGLTPETLDPLSYRWLNGGLGTAIPLLAGWVAWEWSYGTDPRRRWAFTLLAMGLTSLDGLALVESRLALLHPALVVAGLAALGAWGRAAHSSWAWGWRSLAGICLGSAIAVKWNGAGYLLALGLLSLGPGLNWATRLFTLGVLPALTYSLWWWPHLQLMGQNLGSLHSEIFFTHLGLTASHPYQSPWFSWPLLLRPMAYFYEDLGDSRAIALYGTGNPVLWWLSTAALIMVLNQWLCPLISKVWTHRIEILGAMKSNNTQALCQRQAHRQPAGSPFLNAFRLYTPIHPNIGHPPTGQPPYDYVAPSEPLHEQGKQGIDPTKTSCIGRGNRAPTPIPGIGRGISAVHCFAWAKPRLSVMHPTGHSTQNSKLKTQNLKFLSPTPPPPIFLCVTYLTLWLPWAGISRSTFLYHYQPAALLAELALAWLMGRWLTAPRPSWRWAGWTLLGAMLASFGFWLPLWLGWPLPLEALAWRWWVGSWL